MEEEPIEFYERVCEGYRELAKREPDRFILLDGAQSPDAIEQQVWNTVQTKIDNRRNAARAASEAGPSNSKM